MVPLPPGVADRGSRRGATSRRRVVSVPAAAAHLVLMDTISAAKTPDYPPFRPGESFNDYCDRLPTKRHSHTAKGLILLLPRTGMVVVPYEQHRHGWNVVVVRADRDGIYQPYGYSLSVGDREIETGIEMSLGSAAVSEPT